MKPAFGIAVLAAGAALMVAGAAHAETRNPGANTGAAVLVLSTSAEGASSASVDQTKVWNVRKGYKRVRVTTVSQATFEGYYYVAGTLDKVAIPPTITDTAESGSVNLECLRNKRDPWYSSRDSYRTVVSNTARTFYLPMSNPARCRVKVSMSAYNSDSDLKIPGSDLVVANATYSVVRVKVESIR